MSTPSPRRSQPLDPAIEALLDDIDPNAPTMDQMPLADLRASIDDMRRWQGPTADLHKVHDLDIPGPDGPVHVRVYRASARGKGPLVLYTYGGGFITGSLEFADGPARLLAATFGGTLVSVDYRLAPEHPFPAGLEDAYAALSWAAANATDLGGDPGFVAVAGDSSGGNYAAALALMARDRGGPQLSHQLLMYPVLDCDFDTTSYHKYGDGYFLTRRAMQHFWKSYLPPDAGPETPYVAPLRAADLRSLPPTTIVVCIPDPLCAEAEAYASRLGDAGIPTTVTRFDDLVHGCFHMAGITPRAREFIVSAGDALRHAYDAEVVRGHRGANDHQ